MSSPDAAAGQPELTAAQRAARKRRLAEVFGDVLPDQTTDETGPDATDRTDQGSAGDEWLRRQVPPHHG
ncbi:MAG: hypothetical protein JWP74_13 [Marmoricola sp.]|nr:hypothetical protein [Marmoricola sp.]